jgi:Leucine-rich repeat (LRR) protein
MSESFVTSIDALAHCSSLISLDMSWCRQVVQAGSNLHNLTYLDVTGCPCSIAVVNLCSALRTLRIRDCFGLDRLDTLALSTSLETLDMAGCMNLACIRGLAACSGLKRLGISHCRRLTSLEALVACSSLQTLDVSCCPSLPSSKAVLSMLPALRHLKCRQAD